MEIKIISQKISLDEVKALAESNYGDMIKAVVDVERRIMALGGELHADAEERLLVDGSLQENLWGINIYPDKDREEMIEFSSLINVRPKVGNRSMIIENEEIKNRISSIVNKLIV